MARKVRLMQDAYSVLRSQKSKAQGNKSRDAPSRMWKKHVLPVVDHRVRDGEDMPRKGRQGLRGAVGEDEWAVNNAIFKCKGSGVATSHPSEANRR